jgi:hypothetical protein
MHGAQDSDHGTIDVLLRAERLVRRNQERLEETKQRVHKSLLLVLASSAVNTPPVHRKGYAGQLPS